MHFALLEKWNCAPSINLPQLEVLIGTRNRHLRLSFSGWRRLCDSDWLQWTRSLEFCFHAMSHYLDLYWKLKIHVNHLFRLTSFSGLTRRRSHGIWANWMILLPGRSGGWKESLLFRRWLSTWWSCICRGWGRADLHTQSLWKWTSLLLNFRMSLLQISARSTWIKCYYLSF